MNIDIILLASILGAITVISKPILTAIKGYNAIFEKIEKLEDKIDELKSWSEKQQQDIQTNRNTNVALLLGLMNTAKSLQAQGFNHTIEDAIKILDETINKQLLEGKSYLEKERTAHD